MGIKQIGDRTIDNLVCRWHPWSPAKTCNPAESSACFGQCHNDLA